MRAGGPRSQVDDTRQITTATVTATETETDDGSARKASGAAHALWDYLGVTPN